MQDVPHQANCCDPNCEAQQMRCHQLLWQQWLLPFKQLRGWHALCKTQSTTVTGC
jgi:hypothetical protein